MFSLTLWPELRGFKVSAMENSICLILKNKWSFRNAHAVHFSMKKRQCTHSLRKNAMETGHRTGSGVVVGTGVPEANRLFPHSIVRLSDCKMCACAA